jgi:hypothetical protein
VAVVVGVVFLLLRSPFAGSDRVSSKDSPVEPEVDPSRPTERPAQGKWVVLFRANDPSVWNTDSPEESFAVPVQRAAGMVRYLRLRRMDTGQEQILAVDGEQLLRQPGSIPAEGHWWNGTAREEHGARHLGIVQAPRLKWPGHGGTISVMNDGWDAFAGSGFGQKHNGAGKEQFYCWQGKEIPRTTFEIAVSPGPLTDAEQRSLLK